jgi:hypothetical protein
MIGRRLLLAFLLGASAPVAAHAVAANSAIGASGEVYSLHGGTYRSLFADAAPGDAADNEVLALDIVRNGTSQRLLVPGTDGPERERWPALTVDRATNRVFLVWEAQRPNFPLSVLNLIALSDEVWGSVFQFAADPFSYKRNPQLATTLDRYQMFGAEGEVVTATRTILHLAWYDDDGGRQRVLYTPLVVEGGEVLQSNRVFDVPELAFGSEGAAPGSALAPAEMRQKPQVRSGRDGQSVVIAFVAPGSDVLSSLELRSVTGELVSFADKARAQVIETGIQNPGLGRRAIADKARAQVIETGRRLMRREVADYLSEVFLDRFGDSTTDIDLTGAAEEARAQVIETGVSLRRGIADKALADVIEIGRSDGTGTSHLLDVRKASRRELPPLPESALRVFLSQRGDDAAVAWEVDGTVRYHESTADGGWSPVHTLALGPGLSDEEAFALVAKRLADR